MGNLKSLNFDFSSGFQNSIQSYFLKKKMKWHSFYFLALQIISFLISSIKANCLYSNKIHIYLDSEIFQSKKNWLFKLKSIFFKNMLWFKVQYVYFHKVCKQTIYQFIMIFKILLNNQIFKVNCNFYFTLTVILIFFSYKYLIYKLMSSWENEFFV